jgi:hypothetical protein
VHDDRGSDGREGAALEFSDSEDDGEELAVSKGRQRIIRENVSTWLDAMRGSVTTKRDRLRPLAVC